VWREEMSVDGARLAMVKTRSNGGGENAADNA
jgi:hypothetical protein